MRRAHRARLKRMGLLYQPHFSKDIVVAAVLPLQGFGEVGGIGGSFVSRVLEAQRDAAPVARAHAGQKRRDARAAMDGNSFIQSTVGQLVGSQKVAIYLKSNGQPYPFDSYQAHWRVFTIDTALSTPLPPLEIVDKTDWVGGFDVRIKQGTSPSSEESTAIFSRDIFWDIQRSVSDKLAVLLLGLLMLVGALSSIMVTTAILQRRRPPSLAALGWLAAFLFALFEVRAALPGNPPSGNAFDRYLFFPVLLVLTVSTVLLLLAWLRRHDWDMENPLKPAAAAQHDELRQENASI